MTRQQRIAILQEEITIAEIAEASLRSKDQSAEWTAYAQTTGLPAIAERLTRLWDEYGALTYLVAHEGDAELAA